MGWSYKRGPPREQRPETTAAGVYRHMRAWGLLDPAVTPLPSCPVVPSVLLFGEGGNIFHPSIAVGLSLSLWAALAGTASTSLGYPGIQIQPRAFQCN